MEKTLVIDGKNITFKCTGGTLYRYKQQFGRELMEDAAELIDFAASGKKKKIKIDGVSQVIDDYDFTKLNLELVYNLAWVMAKTADTSIPDPQAWLDSFDTFPIGDIIPTLIDMLEKSLVVNKKNA